MLRSSRGRAQRRGDPHRPRRRPAAGRSPIHPVAQALYLLIEAARLARRAPAMSRRLVLALVLVCSGCWCPTIGLAERGELGRGATLAVVNSSSFPIERVEVVLGNAILNCRSDDQLQGTPIPPGGLRCFELAPGERRVWVVSPVRVWALGRSVARRARGWPGDVGLRPARDGGRAAPPALRRGVLGPSVRPHGRRRPRAGARRPGAPDLARRGHAPGSRPFRAPTFRVTRRDGGTEEVQLAPGSRVVGHVLPDGQEVSLPVECVASIAPGPSIVRH